MLNNIMLNLFENKTILITGGSGSLGTALVSDLLKRKCKKIIIYSRDEHKQEKMYKAFSDPNDKLRFFLGDVRDKERLKQAFEGVDYVIHAAAQKIITSAEYNPWECIKTNVIGSMNVVDLSKECGIKKAILVSTDKACEPFNFYGTSKALAEKSFINGNAYSGNGYPFLSCVRYGNVAMSNGSVIPFFSKLIKEGKLKLPVTDIGMTRFFITLSEAVELIYYALENMIGGEIFIPKIPSILISDLVLAFEKDYEIIGIRAGEKIHEKLITEHESKNTFYYADRNKYIIYPNNLIWWKKKNIKDGGVPVDFKEYESFNNEYLTIEEIKNFLNIEA